VLERRFAGPAVLHHPAAELLDVLQIEIECLGADTPTTLAQVRQSCLQSAGRYVGPGAESAEVKQAPYPLSSLPGISGGASFAQQGLLKVG